MPFVNSALCARPRCSLHMRPPSVFLFLSFPPFPALRAALRPASVEIPLYLLLLIPNALSIPFQPEVRYSVSTSPRCLCTRRAPE